MSSPSPQQLERTGKLEAAGGLAYLSSIARDTPTAANVRAYADIVRERSLLRQLIRAGTDIASAVFNNDGETARELVDRAEQKVFEIAEGTFRKRDGAVAVRTLLPGVIDQIDEWHNNPDKLRGLPTGFTDFDKLTGGLRPGDLVIVAGRPSMGKTTLAVNMAEYAAVQSQHRARRWPSSAWKCPPSRSSRACSPPSAACRSTACAAGDHG